MKPLLIAQASAQTLMLSQHQFSSLLFIWLIFGDHPAPKLLLIASLINNMAASWDA